MKIAVCRLESASPYSQSKHYDVLTVPKKEKEDANAYEQRTWRNRAHFDKKGMTYIPGMSFKKSLEAAAKRRGDKIPGKRNATWTKHFLSGIMVLDDMPLGVHVDKVDALPLFVPSDGVSGSGKRVNKIFPIWQEWSGVVTFHILDDEITESAFKAALEDSGKFVGLGFWRAERGGMYGRFSVKSVDWKDEV
jgi:hypothetical protein